MKEKKTILSINTFNIGSTGNIMLKITERAREHGYTAVVACPKSRDNLRKQVEEQIFIGNRLSRNIHIWLAKITGYNGCFSYISTLRFLKKVKEINPDIIHLHNIHGWYINIPMLFRYIKKNDIQIVWTLHDCWAFTGQCPHFTMAKCERWKNGCYKCKTYREYPAAYVDRTKTMWKLKKKWFLGVKEMTLITPSQWLANLVKHSFLQEYSVKVIYNGIDLNIFKPTQGDFRIRYGISKNKYIVLGVAFGWGEKKGLNVFIKLAETLDENYQIVLVGTDEVVEQQLPDNIISIYRTQDQKALAEIYTSASVFVNPTYEDNFPTVNLEALACGTPVITFNTGGSPETIDDTCGVVVNCDDVDTMRPAIIHICETKPYSESACMARAKKFDMQLRFEEYIKLYGEKCREE